MSENRVTFTLEVSTTVAEWTEFVDQAEIVASLNARLSEVYDTDGNPISFRVESLIQH